MSHRVTTAMTLAVLGALAVASVGYAFILTLAPSARTRAEAPSAYVGDLGPASYKFMRYPVVGHGSPPYWEGEVLLLRKPTGQVVALYIPVKAGVLHTPESRYWEAAHPCQDLAVNFEELTIGCRKLPANVVAPGFVRRWSLDGTKLHDGGVNLERLGGSEEGGYFIFNY